MTLLLQLNRSLRPLNLAFQNINGNTQTSLHH